MRFFVIRHGETAWKFFVIRHGETAWNVEGRFQGQKDTALNEKGLAQAATLGERLAGHSFEAVLTSPR